MKLQLGITSKLTLIFVLFAVTLLSGLGALAYINGRAALEAATRSELLSKAVDEQAALNNWVDERLSRLVALADTPSLIETLEALAAAVPGTPEARAARDRLVGDLLSRTGPGQPFLALLVIEPENGQVIAATNPEEEGKYKETLPFFINGLNGPYVQNVYYSTAVQGPAMTVSAPMRASDGRVLAVLAGWLNLGEMNAILQRRTGLRQTDEVFLVNTSNLFVTQPRLVPDPAVLQRGVHTEAVNRCLTRTSGVLSARDYRGLPAIIVYRWLPEREVCLIVKLDQAEAFAPVRAFGGAIALVGGLVLAAAALLAFGLARTITRPIRALQAGAAHFGRGELDYPIDVRGADEIGELACSMAGMAANLSRSRGELETANKELEAFSYSVSHDLRAPLRAIDGFSRILLEDYAASLPAEARRYLGLVRSNTQQMGELVDDLLAFSRLSRQPLNKQTIAPARLAQQALADLRAEQAGRQIEIIIGDLPACEGDPALLKQVFVNLLSNALKFTRAREAAKIEVGFAPTPTPPPLAGEGQGEGAYFVRDNGVGFDMQYVGKLFGVFQRLHRAEDYDGTGVGLAIVQRIISRHGGRAWAEAEVNQGATFYFSL
jgi:signal transduction histidine kinase